MSQHPGQRHPLGLAPGELPHIQASPAAHPEALERGLGLPTLPHGRRRPSRRAARAPVRGSRPVSPAPPDLTLIGQVHPCDDPQQGGLSRTVDTHDPDPVPVRNRE